MLKYYFNITSQIQVLKPVMQIHRIDVFVRIVLLETISEMRLMLMHLYSLGHGLLIARFLIPSINYYNRLYLISCTTAIQEFNRFIQFILFNDMYCIFI